MATNFPFGWTCMCVLVCPSKSYHARTEYPTKTQSLFPALYYCHPMNQYQHGHLRRGSLGVSTPFNDIHGAYYNVYGVHVGWLFGVCCGLGRLCTRHEMFCLVSTFSHSSSGLKECITLVACHEM